MNILAPIANDPFGSLLFIEHIKVSEIPAAKAPMSVGTTERILDTKDKTAPITSILGKTLLFSPH